jgi:hypothetical protein
LVAPESTLKGERPSAFIVGHPKAAHPGEPVAAVAGAGPDVHRGKVLVQAPLRGRIASGESGNRDGWIAQCLKEGVCGD